MLVLFDHCTPRCVACYLIGHTVKPALRLGGAQLLNGDLLKAEEAGFDVMVSGRQEHPLSTNLSGRKIALVVLSRSKWSLVEPMIDEVIAAVNAAAAGSYVEIHIPGD